jgi:hypothetical protein
MEPEIAMILNLGSSAIVGTAACVNRSGLRKKIKKEYGDLGKLYDRVSPTLEHFAYGYTFASIGFGLGNYADTLTSESLPFFNNFSNFVGALFGGATIWTDFKHETNQAVERKKIYPAQFLGTCAGVATSVITNLEFLVN